MLVAGAVFQFYSRAAPDEESDYNYTVTKRTGDVLILFSFLYTTEV